MYWKVFHVGAGCGGGLGNTKPDHGTPTYIPDGCTTYRVFQEISGKDDVARPFPGNSENCRVPGNYIAEPDLVV